MRKFVILYPDTLERKYRRQMRFIVGNLDKQIQTKLKEIFSRKDDIEEQQRQTEEIAALVAFLLLWWQNANQELAPILRGLFRDVNVFNDTQFRKMVKSLTGLTLPVSQSLPYKFGIEVSSRNDVSKIFGETVDIDRNDTFTPLVEKTWLENQNTVINQDVNKAIGDVETIAKTAVLMANSLKFIREEISRVLTALTNRLERFAISQINLADNLLARYRQTGLGLRQYTWQTRLDERVRGNPNGKYPRSKPSHWAREGQLFNWANPPEGGNPGEAPGCRCRAIARMPTKSA